MDRYVEGSRRAAVSAAIPAGWCWRESVTVVSPDGRANLIFSSEPLSRRVTLDAYVAEQGRLLHRDLPSFCEHALTHVQAFGNRPAFARDFSWTPADGERVRQLQLYAVRRSRGYVATATVVEAKFVERKDVLRSILDSLRIGLDQSGRPDPRWPLARRRTHHPQPAPAPLRLVRD